MVIKQGLDGTEKIQYNPGTNPGTWFNGGETELCKNYRLKN